jgi:hypothetical protein
MPIQSDNAPDILTLEEWKGLNQQAQRDSIDDQEEFWNENFFAIGPGNLRTCWGPSAPIYTAPSGVQILRIFFGFIGELGVTEGQPNTYSQPPPGRFGWMFLSDGTIDQVDLDTQDVVHISGTAGRNIWTPIAPKYWASAKVWRPRWVGQTQGEQGGVLFGSPQPGGAGTPGGYYAWDGSVLSAPGETAPRWLTGEDPPGGGFVMPVGLPGIYAMEVYKERMWIVGKDVTSFSAPINGADFSTIHGGGSFGYYGDKLTYAFMDLAASAGYLYFYGDSSTDIVANVQITGQGTVADPALTNFNYTNVDPQVGQRFPRPVGRWGRYHVLFNGAGIFLMYGGDAQVIGEKVTNTFITLDTSQYYPTMAPATMFGFRVMLVNGRFKDPWGVPRSMQLMWHGNIKGREFWSVASQGLELTQIGSYEDNSVITPYGTDGTHLYRLFAQPSSTLTKKLSSKFFRGRDKSGLTIKNFKRIYAELYDLSGRGVSVNGSLITRGGGIPGGTQGFSFQLAPGQGYGLEAQPLSGNGVAGGIDLQSNSPDFVIERLHIGAEERTLYGA